MRVPLRRSASVIAVDTEFRRYSTSITDQAVKNRDIRQDDRTALIARRQIPRSCLRVRSRTAQWRSRN